MFKTNLTLYRVLWWGLANMDNYLMHSVFGDQGPPHIFLTNTIHDWNLSCGT
jgi:hypothetical protein